MERADRHSEAPRYSESFVSLSFDLSLLRRTIWLTRSKLSIRAESISATLCRASTILRAHLWYFGISRNLSSTIRTKLDVRELLGVEYPLGHLVPGQEGSRLNFANEAQRPLHRRPQRFRIARPVSRAARHVPRREVGTK